MPDSNRGSCRCHGLLEYLLQQGRSLPPLPRMVSSAAPSGLSEQLLPLRLSQGKQRLWIRQEDRCEARPLPSAPESPLSFLVEGGGERGDLQPATIRQGAGNLCPQQVPEGSAEGALSPLPSLCHLEHSQGRGGWGGTWTRPLSPPGSSQESATGRAAPPQITGSGERGFWVSTATQIRAAPPELRAAGPASWDTVSANALCPLRSASLWRGEEAEGREERHQPAAREKPEGSLRM